MNIYRKSALALAVAAFGLGGFSSSASARAVGSAIGRAFPFDDGCLTHPFGFTVFNGSLTCSGTKNWETALAIDSPGWFHPNIYYHRSGDVGMMVACNSFAVSPDGRTIMQTGYVSAPLTSSEGWLTPGFVDVPANGYLFVGCDLTSDLTGSAEIDVLTW